jgi:uncharacterized protein RhaS with RHS repeats
MKALNKYFVLIAAALFIATQAQAVLTWARPYDPNLGRWIQRDPIGEQGGLNLYAYVNNNPIIYIDPLGTTWVVSNHPFKGQSAGSYGPYAKFFNDGSQLVKPLHTLTKDQLNQLLEKTYDRLKNKCHDDSDRNTEKTFDTKIFRGLNADMREYYEFDGDVFADNEINYLGIGMYEAWMGDPLMAAEVGTIYWKIDQYGKWPSDGTFYWLNYGYDNYKDKAVELPKEPMPFF